ncbi:cytochrome P450 [Nocardia terpenica]|uniref:cytochrome P450 n=1 Tax=Nocardia terpenica TaxID=455432 RepID=UPI0018939D21|nr:cytochrome P450 [Nocardia terpenica]MBF6059324.1 cytochrome P450 [Nocardia terpenica]MBF6103137.1 cytochrome P450 [Nocardia terpenica]MBF6110674.1 cytochrome P450 [Nocardia terpenica]MBF6116805.1 cytochrome P450 [Nocardia terpenica]
MNAVSELAVDPFAPGVRGIDDPHPARAALRAAGPIVRVEAPAGGPVWVITDAELARRAFVHPQIVKDPACAPEHWDPRRAGLEPTAAEQLSLTTTDGPVHAKLRRAHTPLFTARRTGERLDRMRAFARDLLTACADAGTVDLARDFTTRYPLAVVCDVLGVPPDRIDRAIAACRGMYSGDPAEVERAMTAFGELAAAALEDGRGLAVELRDRVPADLTESQLHYLLFTLLFAGQLTTDPAVGFLLARMLAPDAPDTAPDELVRDTLRRHAPAPFSLWRFTCAAIEFGGVRLPARSPLLIDIQGIGTDPRRTSEPDLVFGAGPHYCTGVHLASWELRAVVDVLRADFPRARLAVPYEQLRQQDFGGIQGSRLTALPVRLRG